MFSVEVRNVTKIFKRYKKPAHRLLELLTGKKLHEEFWALKNILFNVPQGQVLGIIGENGAGKSTLLKILAGTLMPSSGEVITQGKITALLELGAGFHPDFTGRQNIYLNASLLGFSEQEIMQKEQDIIKFSELEDFIDRPVKTYSSGMYVRLAFSIATNVDPDILIIDEALAVGDQHFQKKCIDRMVDFCKRRKTVIFCSHNLYQVNLLCQRAIWIHKGKIQKIGPTKEVTREYEDYSLKKNKRYHHQTTKSIYNINNQKSDCKVLKVWAENNNKAIVTELQPFQDLILKMKIIAFKEVKVHFGFAILRNDDLLCFCSLTSLDTLKPQHLYAGEVVEVQNKIKNFSLLDGTYKIIGGILDTSGLHIYHHLDSKSLTVKSPRQVMGLVDFKRQWKFQIQKAQRVCRKS